MVRLFLMSIALGGFGSSVGMAVTQSPSAIEQQLDYVNIQLGDATTQVQKGVTLPILRGDRFKIERAFLVGNRQKADRIDVVGYASSANSKDDSGRWIDSKDVIARFAVAGTTDRFAVKVYRGSRLCGEVYLQIIEPALNYATVSINGSNRMLREADVLVVKDTDQFKIERVVTNFGEDKEVKVRIEPLDVRGKNVDFKLFEMQLLRKNVVFAKISLQVRGS